MWSMWSWSYQTCNDQTRHHHQHEENEFDGGDIVIVIELSIMSNEWWCIQANNRLAMGTSIMLIVDTRGILQRWSGKNQFMFNQLLLMRIIILKWYRVENQLIIYEFLHQDGIWYPNQSIDIGFNWYCPATPSLLAPIEMWILWWSYRSVYEMFWWTMFKYIPYFVWHAIINQSNLPWIQTTNWKR